MKHIARFVAQPRRPLGRRPASQAHGGRMRAPGPGPAPTPSPCPGQRALSVVSWCPDRLAPLLLGGLPATQPPRPASGEERGCGAGCPHPCPGHQSARHQLPYYPSLACGTRFEKEASGCDQNTQSPLVALQLPSWTAFAGSLLPARLFGEQDTEVAQVSPLRASVSWCEGLSGPVTTAGDTLGEAGGAPPARSQNPCV